MPVAFGPFVCAGCCWKSRKRRGIGNCSYVSGLLIGSRALTLMGLRPHLGLISGKVGDDLMGRQPLEAMDTRSSQRRAAWSTLSWAASEAPASRQAGTTFRTSTRCTHVTKGSSSRSAGRRRRTPPRKFAAATKMHGLEPRRTIGSPMNESLWSPTSGTCLLGIGSWPSFRTPRPRSAAWPASRP